MRLISIWSLTLKLGLVAMLGCSVDEQLILDQRLAELESGIEQELISVDGLTHLDKFTWSEPVNLGPPVNTSSIDIMPTLSQDERSLYFVSNREPGGVGGTDIWVARRSNVHSPWQTPVNLGVINSPGAEADPTLSSDGRVLFFSSNRGGMRTRLDIYVSRRRDANDDLGWGPPENIGPHINTTTGERGADYVVGSPNTPALLYFNRGMGLAESDIYSAPITQNGEPLAAAQIVAELNAIGSATGGQSLRMDGKEIYFMSNRGADLGLDIWVSSRQSRHESWGTPENVGAPINTTFAEERPDLSFDGRTLLFDSDRPHADGLVDQDIWMSTRILNDH